MTTNASSNASSSAPADPQERPHPLATGHRLDEFELLEVIGEGGFGIVYRAYDHSLQREVAIKEYMPSMLARRVGDDSVHVRSDRLTATFQAGLRSFINEARTLAQFSHPALVRVHRFWEANSTAYMAIQLYRGRTLRRLAEEEPSKVTEAWLLGMLGPLLGALETLHRSQCFHRDIAPDNIFIQQDDLPVLLDFGAARKSIADLVDEVAVMVKSGYSPIEQYADDNTLLQGAWTDLYALGAVLYRAVTGHPPPPAVPPGENAPGSNVAAAPGGAATPSAPAASAPAASLTPLDSVPVIAPAPAAPPTAAVPPTPATPATPATPPEPALATSEVEDWNLAQAENTREGYEAYLRRYRRGLHAREARNAIAELNRLSPTMPAAPGTTPTNAVPTVVAGGPTPPTQPAAPPGNGRVVLNIRPWGQVFVDGADRGVSPPLKSLSLRPGIYNIEVRNGDLDVYRQRVTVQDSRSAPVVSHEFK
jgi:non-specific serine/threonine protein kinase